MKETELHCDVLLQRHDDGKFHPVSCFSKTTSPAESRYHSFELEALAIIYALRCFRVYLEGIPFKIVTDCSSLTMNCLKCLVYAAPVRASERNLYSIPKRPMPFDTIHVEHFGPLPSISSKRKHILVVIDAFTKFVKLYPTKFTSTKEVIGALEKYLQYYSRPRRIVTDRGTCFTSFEFEDFLLKRNVLHVKLAVASPRPKGKYKGSIV